MPRHAFHARCRRGRPPARRWTDYVPALAKNDESVVAQYTMTTLEELGLLKMDLPGPAEPDGPG
ncbi:MAG: hypothetical protein ACLSAF_17045 [Intestinimonas sp.]